MGSREKSQVFWQFGIFSGYPVSNCANDLPFEYLLSEKTIADVFS